MGLGDISSVHQRVLASLGVEVVAGVDPNGWKQASSFPVVSSIDKLTRFNFDVALVATPTGTHLEIGERLADLACDSVLLEKPMVSNGDQLVELMSVRKNIYGIYHSSEGPEVSWLRHYLDDPANDHGAITGVESVFADPILDASAFIAKGNSWLDSGINSLSIIGRFTDLVVGNAELRMLDRVTFEGVFELVQGGRASVLTTWGTRGHTKTTRLSFDDGAVFTMDHRAMSVTVASRGIESACFEAPTSPTRLVQQYSAVFLNIAANEWHGSRATDLYLHRLLLEPENSGLAFV